MKKTRLIALVMVFAIKAVGAGYAAWQEELVINETVSTGSLDLDWTWGIAALMDNNPLYTTIAEAYFADENTFVASLNNLYPGVWYNFDLGAKNKGTIPAIIQDVTVDLSAFDNNLAEDIRVYGFIYHKRLLGSFFGIPIYRIINTKYVGNGLHPVSLSNLEDELDDIAGWKILPDDEITFGEPGKDDEGVDFDALNEYKQYMASELEGYDIESENCLFLKLSESTNFETENLPNQKFEINIDFKQFNQ